MNKYELALKLKELGPLLLHANWKNRWSKERPTTGYCYLVSEILFHYIYPNSKAFVLKINDETHWFIKNDEEIIDWTSDQFDSIPPYSGARRAAFFKGSIETRRGKISKKAYQLAQYLGVQTDIY
jgi:hypothetical protein